MKKLMFFLCVLAICGGAGSEQWTLQALIDTAMVKSALLQDYAYQINSQTVEQERLRAVYMRSQVEVTGEWLFVPVVSRDGGKTAFLWNAQSDTDYFGYDLGESSGHLHAGVHWTQPLLGVFAYKAEHGQAEAQTAVLQHRARLERHQLGRTVTEQYLLCLLSRAQAAYTDTLDVLLEQQIEELSRMADNGLAKQSDLRLLRIEQQTNADARIAAEQAYTQHIADLRAVCGLQADEPVGLPAQDIDIPLTPMADRSLFTETYRLDSLRIEAEWQALRAPYLPQLDVFVNGGLQTGNYDKMYRHFGWAAGLTFRWKIYGGRQQHLRTQQIRLRQAANDTYRSSAERQRRIRVQQCLDTWQQYDARLQTTAQQLAEYDAVLHDYALEMQAGQLSVLDYLLLLRRRMQARQDYLLLLTNRRLAAVAYNYWNY